MSVSSKIFQSFPRHFINLHSLLNVNFAWHRILGCQLFSSSALKALFYSLLASIVADEKSCIHQVVSFVDNLYSILWSLLILFLCLWCFIMIWLDVDLIMFILLRTLFLKKKFWHFFLWNLVIVYLQIYLLNFHCSLGHLVLASTLLNISFSFFFFLGRSVISLIIFEWLILR